MKRLTVFLIAMMIAGTLSAQIPNWYRYQMTLHGGLKIGNTIPGTGTNKAGSLLIKVDSIRGDNATTPTLFKVYKGATQLIPDIPAGGSEDITGNVIIAVSDTTVTLALGRIVYKTSNNHFYGCVRINSTGSGTRWKQLDN